MTDYGDTSAWITLSNGSHTLYLKTAKQPTTDENDPSMIGIDYSNRGHWGMTLNSEEVIVKIPKIFATTKAEWDSLKEGIRVMQESSTEVRLRIQINTTPEYEAFDGTTGIYMPVHIKNIRGKGKVYNGNATIYEIAQIELKQTGALAAV
jgi:hypothetical protein